MENREEEEEEWVDANDGDNESDEPDLSMVLALLLRSGQVRLSSGQSIRYMGYESDDDSDSGNMEPDNNLQVPDTMKDSDLTQDILLSSAKLRLIPGLHCSERIVKSLRDREIGCCGVNSKAVFTPGCKNAICSQQLPTKILRRVQLGEKVFCGIFSEDGKTYLSACQDGFLRVFDVARFKDRSSSCEPFKTIPAINVGWSILDVAFSPDALYTAYSTWSSDIHIASIYDNGDASLSSHTSMDLRPENPSFAAFSLQFSGDNNEILCGANDGHLYIYDRNLCRRTSRIHAHEDDVNAIRFADKSSQILFSGGDDGLINVWDRRALREHSAQKVGSFAGHVDGITFLDSKEDSRFLLSNSKDQAIKVWDMRKFSSLEAQNEVKKVVAHQMWDYRWQRVPKRQKNRKKTVAGDTSVKTYQGHTVTNTLIRARFSPMHTTGQRYIYTGCAKGSVIIYDVLTGEIVTREIQHRHCVRDVSWHPYEPMLASSSWDGHFFIWNHSNTDDDAKSSRLPRKRRHKVDECCDDEHTPSRRSPRFTRSSWSSWL